MNMEKITTALGLCVDALGYDHPGVIKIDEAGSDDEVKAGLSSCLETLDSMGKITIAEQIRELTRGWL
jgi:hypothetical protein